MLIFNLEICNFSLCILIGQDTEERLLTLNYSKCAQFLSLYPCLATLITGHVTCFPLEDEKYVMEGKFQK